MKWKGTRPVKCDLCRRTLEGFFVDGKIASGPWGILCVPCHTMYGVGLGTGKGQKYRLSDLEKAAG